ncbi:MAG: transglycosylase domain-containing protein [Oscillospiraceae bacterium]|nr:transglycosylase domain-containing protein [Oscillospiraceae bacterium]
MHKIYHNLPEEPPEKLKSAPKPKSDKRPRRKGKLTPVKGVKHVLSVIGTTFLTLFLIIVITGCVVAVALSVYITQFAESMYDVDLQAVELSYNSFLLAKNPHYNPEDPESEEYIELFALSADENRIWVDLEDIPQHAIDALVATEDKRFYDHAGVDWYRTAGATLSEFAGIGEARGGGSTITQQLVRDITKDDQVNIGRKLREIFRAISFEQKYSKHDILESYLNRVALGNTVYGIGSAAKHYFDKEASELTIAESCILIGLLPSPVSYNPYYNPERSRYWQKNAIWNMYDQGYISFAEYEEALNEQVQFRLPISSQCRCPEELPRCDGAYFGYIDERYEEFYGLQGNADDEDLYFQNVPMEDLINPFKFTEYAVRHNWYIDAALKEITADLAALNEIPYENAAALIRKGGYKIYLSMDIEMQDKLEAIYNDPYLVRNPSYPYAAGTPARNTIQSAFVVMDMHGNVVAVAGGVGDKPGNDAFNRANQARRNIGSTIKPFGVYAPAIDMNKITYSSMLLDLAGLIDDPGAPGQFKDWPENYGGSLGSGSNYAAWYALAKSTNTVSARTMHLLGPNTALNFLQERLGITTLTTKQHLTYSSLATGSMEVKLHELAGAFQIFGTGGIYYKPAFYSRIEDHNGNIIMERDSVGSQAIGADSAWVVNRMMRDVVEDPNEMGRRAQLPMPNVEIIGKTGTANDMSDVLFAGLTPDYVAVIRLGYDDNRALSNQPGGGDWWRPPTIVWGEIMSKLIPIDQPRGWAEVKNKSGAVEDYYCASTGLMYGPNCAEDGAGRRVGYYKSSNIPARCTHDATAWAMIEQEQKPLYRILS